jgi:transposase
VEPIEPAIPAREAERMRKLQDVILRAMARKLTWIEAAEIAGMSVRNMQRKRQAYIDHGYTGLFDQRRGKRSIHRIPMETAEKVLGLFRDKYFDLNVRHFHEKLKQVEGIEVSYSWVKQALQGAGLVSRRRKRGPHRKRRPRRPLPGMLLHSDGSKHRWFQDDRYYDLIVVMDDATSEIYYAQLVEEESTLTTMAAFREVMEQQGLFCASYSDRGSHFFVTPKAGEKVDPHRPTQLGRALKELGVKMIAAYSPQARGRSERNFGTWQGRLPQELRLAGITGLAEANRFLRERYIGQFNQQFTVAAAEQGTAFRKCGRRDLDWVFSIQTERVVSKDNTVAIGDQWWQIDKCRWRHSLAGQTVTVHQHLDGTVSIRYGPHVAGRYDSTGQALKDKPKTGRGKDGPVEAVENRKAVSHRSPRPLEIASGDSHFSTATNPTRPLSPNRKAKRAA